MNPVIGLSLGRIAFGATALVNPDLTARTVQLDPVANPQLPFAIRLLGTRDLALGLATLVSRGRAQRGMLGLGVLVDGGDAAAAYLAMQHGALTRKTALIVVAPAVAAVGSGLVGLLKR
jgi:hypothetical protein